MMSDLIASLIFTKRYETQLLVDLEAYKLISYLTVAEINEIQDITGQSTAATIKFVLDWAIEDVGNVKCVAEL